MFMVYSTLLFNANFCIGDRSGDAYSATIAFKIRRARELRQ